MAPLSMTSMSSLVSEVTVALRGLVPKKSQLARRRHRGRGWRPSGRLLVTVAVPFTITDISWA